MKADASAWLPEGQTIDDVLATDVSSVSTKKIGVVIVKQQTLLSNGGTLQVPPCFAASALR